MEEQKSTAPESGKNLSATITHKLKSPLTTLNLYSEALLSGSVGELSAEQREYIEEISKASKKMVAYVNDLPALLGAAGITRKE